MGVVYKARQKSLDRLVALKILPKKLGDKHESFAERFTREAKALARLQHPNIVNIYDSGAVEGMYYFIMEFVDGSNVRQLLGAQDGRLAPNEALAILPGVCDALEYAHTEGIAHRDIKPENILVDRRGRVKIADFGIAKLLQRPGTDYTLTHTQQIIGTMHYMAPEQIERPSMVDHRADIYSLGVVLYEMMTGELPIGRFPLPSERGISDTRLDEVVLRALEKEPDRRYQRASEIKTDLMTLSGQGITMTPGSYGSGTYGQAYAMQTYAQSPLASNQGPAWRRAATMNKPGTSLPESLVAPRPGLRSVGVAYLCWVMCFVGFNGIHRLYAGKWISGFIWLLTLGLLFIGQIVDLVLIPGMVNRANRRLIARQSQAGTPPPMGPTGSPMSQR